MHNPTRIPRPSATTSMQWPIKSSPHRVIKHPPRLAPLKPMPPLLDRQNGQAAEARAPAPAVPQANRREARSTAQEQMAAFDGTPSTPTGNGRAQVSPGRAESSPQSPSVSPVSARLPGAPAPAVAGVTAAQPPAAVQPSMEQRPAQRAELPSAPASPTQTDKKEDTPDPQKLMLYQNRLALGGVVGNVLGKVRDAMTPQQNKPKTQQSSQATQADATSQQSVQAPQANMEQRFAAFEASRMDPKTRRSEAVRCRSICPHRPRCTKHIQRRTRRINPQPHPGCRFDNSRWNTTGSRGNASRRRL